MQTMYFKEQKTEMNEKNEKPAGQNVVIRNLEAEKQPFSWISCISILNKNIYPSVQAYLSVNFGDY